MAGHAKLAVIAVDGGLQNRTIARGPARHSGTSPYYNSGRLMSQHHRIEARCIPDSAFGEVMQIGSADSNGFDGDLNLARARIRDSRNIFELELMGFR